MSCAGRLSGGEPYWSNSEQQLMKLCSRPSPPTLHIYFSHKHPATYSHVRSQFQYLSISLSLSLLRLFCLHSWITWWRSRGQGLCVKQRHRSLSPPYPARQYCTAPQVFMATTNWPKLTAPLPRSPLTYPGWRRQHYNEQPVKSAMTV